MKKTLSIIFISVVVIALCGGYFYFYIPFSDSGVKAGVLNNFKHKGVIFKTYEGELIQSGFRPAQTGLTSNEFNFSVDDPKVAAQLMSLSGRFLQLHYKEYYGRLPWRGYSKFVVDSIVEMTPMNSDQNLPIIPPTSE